MDTFKQSVLALAQPADVQLSRFPDFVATGEELALDFEDGLRELASITITDEQRAAVDALDQQMTVMSGEQNADFWFDQRNIASHPTWDAIRSLARSCVDAFGWNLSELPPDETTYITIGR